MADPSLFLELGAREPSVGGSAIRVLSVAEAHLILWALAEAMANADAADALSDVAFLRPVIHLVHRRIDEAQEE